MKTINFNNHKFQISRDGILFWFDKQIAIISDLHLEKGSSFGPSGQFLPPYDSEDTLTNLLNTIQDYNIKKVILLKEKLYYKKGQVNLAFFLFLIFLKIVKDFLFCPRSCCCPFTSIPSI